MIKFLLISGSPRKGNTDFILGEIFKAIPCDKEIIFLRDKKIEHCLGCLCCDQSNECVIQDDMQGIYKKIVAADVLVVGSPNYFDNVTGLLKDFIDRTNPFYEIEILKGKRLVNIIIGAGKIENSQRVADHALKYFAAAHNFKVIGSYFFQALKIDSVKQDSNSKKIIQKIIKNIMQAV